MLVLMKITIAINHKFKGSIYFNGVNIHRTENSEMYFMIFTGNRDDIEWHDLHTLYYP